MKTVPISEAKTHLPRLVATLIEDNESIQLTRHGVPIARIVPEKQFDRDRSTLAEVLARWKETRKGIRLNGLTIRQLREKGRR